MQKFLVGPNVGGAAITFGAVKYLIRKCGEGLDPLWQAMNENPGWPILESHGEVGFVEQDLFSPLLTAWWKYFKGSKTTTEEFLFDGNVRDNSEIGFLYGESSDLRGILIPFIERLEGNFAEFDKANNDTQLRVVEVPDGFFCGVSEDPETGCEVVEEYPKMWHARYDSEYRILAEIKKFCYRDASTTDWFEDGKVYQLADSLKIVLSGNYGVALCKTDERGWYYLFLAKNTYYRTVGDRPKVVFEIVDEHEAKFGLLETFKEAAKVDAYVALIAKIRS